MIIIIDTGPPLTPNVTVMPTSRTTLLTWVTPLTLIPLSHYLINISVGSELVTMTNLSGDSVSYNVIDLSPATEYSASVVAVNRAGPSEVSVNPFTTLEDGVCYVAA